MSASPWRPTRRRNGVGVVKLISGLGCSAVVRDPVRPVGLALLLAGGLLLRGCVGASSSASVASPVTPTAGHSTGPTGPTRPSRSTDPAAALKIDTVCPAVTDGATVLSVSFEVLNRGPAALT